MGRTLTLVEVGDRNAYDFLREVSRRQEPLTVILDEGINVTLKAEHSEPPPETEEKSLELKSRFQNLCDSRFQIDKQWLMLLNTTDQIRTSVRTVRGFEICSKPLMTLSGYIPDGWKDAIYGRDGSGSAREDNDL